MNVTTEGTVILVTAGMLRPAVPVPLPPGLCL